jgi:hypothetical protein
LTISHTVSYRKTISKVDLGMAQMDDRLSSNDIKALSDLTANNYNLDVIADGILLQLRAASDLSRRTPR